MSVFGRLRDFFVHLFIKIRPGLEDFLKKHEHIAVEEIKRLAAVRSGVKFHEWEQEAWDAIKTAIEKEGPVLYDNWVSILLHLAFENYKAE